MPNLSKIPDEIKSRDREPDFMSLIRGYRTKWRSRMKGGEITEGEKFRDMANFLTTEAEGFMTLANDMDELVSQARLQQQAAAQTAQTLPVSAPAPQAPPQPPEGVPFLASVVIEGKLTPTMLVLRNGITEVYSPPMPQAPAPAVIRENPVTMHEIAAQEKEVEVWESPTPPPTPSAEVQSVGTEGKAQASPKSEGGNQALKTSLKPQAESKEAQLKQNVPQQSQQENQQLNQNPSQLPKQAGSLPQKQNQPSETQRKVLRRNGNYVDFVPDGISTNTVERHLKIAQ